MCCVWQLWHNNHTAKRGRNYKVGGGGRGSELVWDRERVCMNMSMWERKTQRDRETEKNASIRHS